MSDVLEQAALYEEHARQEALAKARQPVKTLACKGRCHFCDEPAPRPALFCDSDCQSDFVRVQDAKRRAGTR